MCHKSHRPAQIAVFSSKVSNATVNDEIDVERKRGKKDESRGEYD